MKMNFLSIALATTTLIANTTYAFDGLIQEKDWTNSGCITKLVKKIAKKEAGLDLGEGYIQLATVVKHSYSSSSSLLSNSAEYDFAYNYHNAIFNGHFKSIAETEERLGQSWNNNGVNELCRSVVVSAFFNNGTGSTFNDIRADLVVNLCKNHNSKGEFEGHTCAQGNLVNMEISSAAFGFTSAYPELYDELINSHDHYRTKQYRGTSGAISGIRIQNMKNDLAYHDTFTVYPGIVGKDNSTKLMSKVIGPN